MNMLFRYGQWLRLCPALSAWAVLLAGFAALAEGLALAALIPLLDALSGQAQPTVERLWAILGWKLEGQALLLACLGLFVLLAAVAAVTRSWSEVLGLDVKARVERAMRERMTDALLAMEWTAFVKLRQGDVAKAMVLEGMQVGTGALYVVSALGAAVAAAGYLLISFAISVELTLISLVFAALGGGVYVLATRSVRRHADRLSHLVGAIGDRSAELFGNLKYFRATGQEATLREQAMRLFNTYGEAYLKSQMYSPALRGGIEILAALFIAGFLYFHLAVRQGSVAEILVFLGVFYRMVPRLLNVQSALFQARTYTNWLDTYDARLHTALAAAHPSQGGRAAKFHRQISFKDVSLTLPGQERPVLSHVNFDLRKGQCIALVGPSGGGKTTLTDILLGLIRPTSGSVEVDGVNLNEIDQTDWRSHIGLVMQESVMLHASIAVNVAMCDAHEIDRGRVESALRAADAWEFVAQLPEGMDTVVAERGARLSGGQRQRIAIARALYRQPSILILDEATSALDSYAEEKIQAVIDKMSHEITTVIVAHRLKTVKNADLICVIADGELRESGTWEELISRRGMLYEMAQRQDMASAGGGQ